MADRYLIADSWKGGNLMRSVLAVIAGYLVIVVFVMVTLIMAWALLGPSFAFQPETTHVTLRWVGLNLSLSVLAAIMGGYVAMWIAPDESMLSVKILGGLILGVGIIMAIAHIFTDASVAQQLAQGVVVEGMSAFSASSEAVQPTWYNFLVPVIGAIGVFIGGRIRGYEATGA
jgi:hypothetical protein